MRGLALFAAVALAGCATASLGQKSTQLNVGMNKEQVQTLLGAPRRTAVSSDGQETWYYWKVGVLTPLPDMEVFASSENRLGITFKDGKVASWGDQYDWMQAGRETMKSATEMSQTMMRNMPPIKIEQTTYQGDKPSTDAP